jgi:alpha-tubulin suppressor-like RCC1 family protein
VAPTYTGEGREHFRAVQVVCGKQHTLGLIANNGRVMSFACGAWQAQLYRLHQANTCACFWHQRASLQNRTVCLPVAYCLLCCRSLFPVGNNVFGQLGLGNWQAVNTMTPIPKLQSKEIVALQAGDFSSAAICDSGDVYLWGRNDCDQLGLGDDMSRCAPALLKGFKVCVGMLHDFL